MSDDDLLTPRPTAEPSAIRDRLADRTAAIVRRHRWFHRAGQFGLVLLGFGLGAAVTVDRGQTVREGSLARVVELAPPVRTEPVAVAPGDLELQAEQLDDVVAAGRKYREAGDLYYRGYGDYRAALRCYRIYLDSAPQAEHEVEDADTQLLRSLKIARELEKSQ